jgi:hypothetical protein
MSTLITSGDTIKNFGQFLPYPYIKKVYLSLTNAASANNTGVVDVDLEIYINAAEYTDVNTLLDSISDFELYLAVFGYDFNGGGQLGSTVEDNLLNQGESIWDQLFYAYEDSEGRTKYYQYLATCETWYRHVPLSTFNSTGDWSDVAEVVYDDKGNRAIKLNISSKDFSDISINSEVDTWGGAPSGMDVRLPQPLFFQDSGEMAMGPGGALDLTGAVNKYLFCWITSNDYIPEDRDTYEELSSNVKNFMDLETSDIAYEQIWSGDDLAPPGAETDIWVTSNGDLYDDTPLQSLSSKFYTTDAVTHAQIVTFFKELVEAYQVTAEADAVLQEMINQISYILETEGTSSGLLVELGLLARAFPNKSGATNVGKLYISYRNMIATTNTAIESGQLITQTVVTNTKVVDNTAATTWADAGASDWDDRSSILEYSTAVYTGPTNYSGPGGHSNTDAYSLPFDAYETLQWGPAGSSTYVGGTLLSIEMVPSSIMYDNYVLWAYYGWTFFAYEKALVETCNLFRYVDYERFKIIFGLDILKGYFQVQKAMISRVFNPSAKGPCGNIGDYCGNLIGSTVVNIGDGYTVAACHHEEGGPLYAQSVPFAEDIYGNKIYPYVLLRNFIRPGAHMSSLISGKLNTFDKHPMGEDIMAFEYTYMDQVSSLESLEPITIQGKYLDGTHGYVTQWCNVLVEDRTYEAIKDIANLYTTAQTGLAEYVAEAQEACASNQFTDYFTDVFATVQLAKYEGDEEASPWVYYPTFYSMMAALITGDSALIDVDESSPLAGMEEEAQKIVDKIGPEGGTLTDLLLFQETFDQFYDDFFVNVDSIFGWLMANGDAAGWYRRYHEYSMSHDPAELVSTIETASGGTGQVGDLVVFRHTKDDLEQDLYGSQAGLQRVVPYTKDFAGPYISKTTVEGYDAGEGNLLDGSATDKVISANFAFWTLDDPGAYHSEGELVWPSNIYNTTDTSLTFNIRFNEPLYYMYDSGTTLAIPNETVFRSPAAVAALYDKSVKNDESGYSWFMIKDITDDTAEENTGIAFTGIYYASETVTPDGIIPAYTFKITINDTMALSSGTTYGVYFDPSPSEVRSGMAANGHPAVEMRDDDYDEYEPHIGDAAGQSVDTSVGTPLFTFTTNSFDAREYVMSTSLADWADDWEFGKIICTELYEQHLLSESIYEADQAFGKMVYLNDPELMKGYHLWAPSVVKLMQNSKLATRLIAILASPWAKQMAYEMGAYEKGSIFGKILMEAGKLFSRVVYKLSHYRRKTNKTQWSK